MRPMVFDGIRWGSWPHHMDQWLQTWLQSVSRMQVAALVSGKLSEPIQIVNSYAAFPQREQVQFTQLPQNAVDVNRGQTQRVGEYKLAQRALVLGFRCQPDQAQSLCQLHEEMSRALESAASPDVDQVLNNHGLIPRRSPQEGSREAWEVRNALHDV